MQIKLTQLLSELGINKPNHTPEEVYKYYNDYILNNYWECDIEEADNIDLMWKEFRDLKYNILDVVNITRKKLELANKNQLNTFYRGMKDLVNKYNLPYTPDDLNELQINNPNPNVEEVYDYFNKHIGNAEISWELWNEYIILAEPYLLKYNIPTNLLWHYEEFEKLSQPDLNKLYSQMKQLVQKYATNNI
jgi:hypothetical protein